MTDTSPTFLDPTDPFRPDRCPDCGYSRQGLPDGAVCPECGFACSGDLMVVYGSEGSMLARTMPGLAARVRRVVVHPRMLLVLAMLAVGLSRLGRVYPVLNRFPVGALFGLFVIGLWVYNRWRLRRDELAARWQLRLSPQGFAQREYLGPAPLHPWTSELRAWMKIDRWPPGWLARRRWPAEKRWVTISIARADSKPWQADFLACVAFACPETTAEHLRRQLEQWLAAAKAPPLAMGHMPWRPAW
jgi:hypothetical protein